VSSFKYKLVRKVIPNLFPGVTKPTTSISTKYFIQEYKNAENRNDSRFFQARKYSKQALHVYKVSENQSGEEK
jgi:hypothetical protein